MDWQNKNETTQARITAAYQADGMTDEVIVPALKALFLGFFGGIISGLFVHLVNKHLVSLPVNGWLGGLMGGIGITAYMFFQFSERAHWMIERITGVDLNFDGWVGEPEPEPAQAVRLIIDQEEGRHVDYLDLGVSPAKVLTLAKALTAGDSLAVNRWAGKGFTRGEIEQIRARLVRQGFAQPKNPDAENSPLILTGKGRATMRQFASMTLSPDGKKLVPPTPLAHY